MKKSKKSFIKKRQLILGGKKKYIKKGRLILGRGQKNQKGKCLPLQLQLPPLALTLLFNLGSIGIKPSILIPYMSS